jgi:drug/metabolite transporter (DMT)-like permease
MTGLSSQLLATGLILLSALLHAIVNTVVKTSDDGLVSRGCMNGFAFLVALPFIAMVPFPDATLWRILLLSVLVHGLYPFFLVEAYRNSDLSSAFPLARGSTPLFVALLSALTLKQHLSATSLVGIVLICAAVASFSFERSSLSNHLRGKATALATGLIIAVYTVIDAIGLRVAPTAFSYIVWLFLLDGAFVAFAVTIARRRHVAGYLRREWKTALVAGILGVSSYGLALLALSFGPVTEIAALRETSVIFAAIIGTLILGEPFGTRRASAAATVVLGVILLQPAF